MNREFCFLFDFGDNDFSRYIELAAERFCDEYNSVYSYHKQYLSLLKEELNNTVSYHEKVLDYMERNFKVLLEAMFIGEYMSSSMLHINVDDNFFSTEDRIDKAKKLLKYLNFRCDEENNDSWFSGTFNEVNNYCVERYKKYQTQDIITKKNKTLFDYWYDSEVLLVYFKNDKLKSKIL